MDDNKKYREPVPEEEPYSEYGGTAAGADPTAHNFNYDAKDTGSHYHLGRDSVPVLDNSKPAPWDPVPMPEEAYKAERAEGLLRPENHQPAAVVWDSDEAYSEYGGVPEGPDPTTKNYKFDMQADSGHIHYETGLNTMPVMDSGKPAPWDNAPSAPVVDAPAPSAAAADPTSPPPSDSDEPYSEYEEAYSEYGDFTDEPIPPLKSCSQPLPVSHPAEENIPFTQDTTANIAAPPLASGGGGGNNNNNNNAAGNNSDKNKHTPVKVSPKRNGSKIMLIALCLLLAAGLGFGGGLLAANSVGDKVLAKVENNFSSMLEEAGGAVLYRSVETTKVNSGDNVISVPSVTRLCADSVVEISTTVPVTSWGLFGLQQGVEQGAGSGIIISSNGYILTCNHVISGADTITVGLRNGNSYEAQVIAADEESDVSVIKIIPDEDLTVAVMGESSSLEVGDSVVAIGNPLGELGGSVTSGIVSATDREVTISGSTYTVLQTDAAINGGNSGGGLFNASGELIGLVNAKAKDIGVEGLSFAIPIDDIKGIIQDLIDYGYVTDRGAKLGVTMVDIDNERTATSYRVDELGVYILQVDSGSNAAYAGLQSGDMLVSIDDEKISSADQVVDIISGHKVDDVIQVQVKRAGKLLDFSITLYGAVPEGSGSGTV